MLICYCCVLLFLWYIKFINISFGFILVFLKFALKIGKIYSHVSFSLSSRTNWFSAPQFITRFGHISHFFFFPVLNLTFLNGSYIGAILIEQNGHSHYTLMALPILHASHRTSDLWPWSSTSLIAWDLAVPGELQILVGVQRWKRTLLISFFFLKVFQSKSKSLWNILDQNISEDILYSHSPIIPDYWGNRLPLTAPWLTGHDSCNIF